MCIALIRYWISLKYIKLPSYEFIQCIYKQIILSRLDANPKIILNNNEIRRYKKSLHLIQKIKEIKNIIIFWHNVNIHIKLPNNLGYIIQNQNGITLPAPKSTELINIRFQYEGKILIFGRDKSRKIKKIWQEKNIFPWLRNQIPLLFYDDILISALGVFIINQKNHSRKTWKISWNSNFSINSPKKKNSFLFF